MINIYIIAVMIFCCLPGDILADTNHCSQDEAYCHEIEIETAINPYGSPSYWNKVVFNGNTCLEMENTGVIQIPANGTYYKVRTRSKNIDSQSMSQWTTWTESGVNPGDVPEYVGAFETDACLDLRPPPDCSTEETQANTECEENNWQWTDAANCEYTCNEPEVCSNIDKANAVAECGNDNYKLFEMQGVDPEHPECGWRCGELDCNDDYEELLEFCAYGISTYDWEKCTGSCRKCYPDARDAVTDICRNRGGIHSFRCEIVNAESEADRKVDIGYNCSYAEDTDEPPAPPEPVDPTEGGVSPPESDPTNPPADPNDPNNQPSPDPVDAPDATEPEKTNNRLDAIKKNSDITIRQDNAKIGQLKDIVSNNKTTAENTKTIADNQGKIQQEVNNLGETIGNRIQDVKSVNESGFKGIVEAIKGQKTVEVDVNYPDALELDFEALKATGASPTLSGDEYDSSLPTDNDYTEHDDNQTLATEQAGNYIAEMELVEEQELIEASITAIGSPCMTGNITFHGNNIPVSICFNKNWMLTGYAIMKVIFIGLAYIQSAIMLTKSII